ncbi:PREDICTED: LOW QUALITY PROTEIN: OTU domain-containing protein 5-like [Priapulus caudatus]|uniref:ubiquitinyl hydrolase 1 n=1 Tax=Priapulus caudatus TaxID=37621 RepID=A0ABM1ESC3_PRICU|nr:PREDICTED: LOW QUALITY PROTEIN: OTU domain-containing protein 5-like [Priapulus caudatus]
MTILPKKKTSKEKNDGENVADHTNKSSLGHRDPTHPVHGRTSRARNSPPHWPPHGYREEQRTPHDPGPSVEPVDRLEGPAPQNKRRHLVSPHRHHARKHRSTAQPVAGPYEQSFQIVKEPSAVEIERELEIDVSGYNSGDEYALPAIDMEEEEELERRLEQALKEKNGFEIKRMQEDGACLFRAIADQVYGDEEMNSVVRQQCMDYMSQNREFFSQYITEDFDSYIVRKRLDHCHGNHVEMQALSEMYNRTVEVYQCRNGINPIKLFQSNHRTDSDVIRLSYHKNMHYNSVINPYSATIGVGLGLPSYKPGLADRNLMTEAMKKSEELAIEQAMLEDKVRATDWEATNEAIEEQVARESYLQWLRDNEKRATNEPVSHPGGLGQRTCSSATAATSGGENWWEQPRTSRSPRQRSHPGSPDRPQPMAEDEDVFFAGLTESEWEEQHILAQVLAESQQEYYATMRRHHCKPDDAGATNS